MPRRRVLGGGNETRRRGKLYAATGTVMPPNHGGNVITVRQCKGIAVPIFWRVGSKPDIKVQAQMVGLSHAQIVHIAGKCMYHEPAKATLRQGVSIHIHSRGLLDG